MTGPSSADAGAPRFRVRAFGGLTVEGSGTAVPSAVTQRKRLAFLALLAASEPRGIARERLLLLLWPEHTTERARAALYQMLYAVRQALGEGSVTGADELRLEAAVVSSDVADFHAALARDDLAGAVSLYGGPFLDAFHVSGAAELERWVEQKRQELARLYQSALSRLAIQAMERGDFTAAVHHATRLLDADPLSDRATLLLMEALAANGDVSAALERARVHAALVRAELGAEVDPSIAVLATRLRSGGGVPTVPRPRGVPAAVEAGTPPNATPATAQSPVRRRSAFMAIGAIVTVAAVAVGASLAVRRPHDLATEFVIVADFQAPPANAPLADVLTESTRLALSESRSLRAVPDSRLASARQRLRVPNGARLADSVARKVALGDGIRTVVAGSLVPVGERFAITIKLLSATSGDVLAYAARTGVTDRELIDAVDTLTRTLRARAGDDLEVIRAQPPLLALTSTSLEAMTLYTAALHAPRDSAEMLLRRAVALDTAFASALWQLSRVMIGGTRDEHRSLLARAYAHRDGLTEYERLRVEMAYLYSHNGQTPDRDRLITHLREIVDKYPNATDATLLGNFYLSRRELAPAESTFRLAIALDSAVVDAYDGAINVYLRQDRIAEARRLIDANVRRFPRLRTWDVLTTYAEGSRGRLRALVQDMLAHPAGMNGESGAHYLLAMLDLLEGRLASSRSHMRTMDSLTRAARRRAVLQSPRIAATYWVSADTAAGLRTLDSALAADSTNRSFDVAELYAQFGKPDVALSVVNVVDSVRSVYPQPSGRTLVMGWVAMARGQPRVAVDSFRASQMASDGPVMASVIAVDPNVGLAFERAQLPDSAIAAYEHYLAASRTYFEDNALRLAWVLEHVAALYERKGRRREASNAYARLVDLWQEADPELQPRVAHARERIAALSR